VLNNKSYWLGGALAVVFAVVGLWYSYSFFHQPRQTKIGTAAPAAQSATANSISTSKDAAVDSASFPEKPVFSETWRVVGGYSGPGRTWVIVADATGRLRVESPSMFQNAGAARVGTIDGERVSTFSGSKAGATAGPSPQGLGPVSK